jgi:hypothetical protein
LRWRVQLGGIGKGLGSHLAELLTEPGLRVVIEGGVAYLESESLESLSTPDEVRAVAAELVCSIRGVLALGGAHPTTAITVGAILRERGDGPADIYVQAGVASLSMRVFGARVVRTGDVGVEQGPSQMQGLTALARRDPDVAKVFRLRSRGLDPCSWADLYRIVEVIQADLKGTPSAVTRGWWTMPSGLRLSGVCRARVSAATTRGMASSKEPHLRSRCRFCRLAGSSIESFADGSPSSRPRGSRPTVECARSSGTEAL